MEDRLHSEPVSQAIEGPADMPSKCSRAAVGIVVVLRKRGYEAYLAGGCVRDILRGAVPKDFDVATNAQPAAVIEAFPGALAVGRSFGVVVVPSEEHSVEVATFRMDIGCSDGRHPDHVLFSDARSDVLRRDFSINALFYDPVENRVIDYVGGLRDLDDGIIRTVGDPVRRFSEDHLRMMRAVRFQGTTGFALHPDTARAIRAGCGNIAKVSVERIRGELVKTLLESLKAGDAILLMHDLGLLGVILPEVAALREQEQNPDLHPEGDVLTHTARMLNAMQTADERIALSVLLHDVGKPPAARVENDRITFHNHADIGATLATRILERLRFPTATVDAVATIVRRHSRLGHAAGMRKPALRRTIGDPLFPVELELHRLDIVGSHGRFENYDFLNRAAREFASEPVLPAPWVTGSDIIALGIPPGPSVGEWKRKAYDLQLENTCADRESVLARIAEEIGRG